MFTNDTCIYKKHKKVHTKKKVNANIKSTKMVIREESPRYRLYRQGADTLKNSELIAIILRNGNRRKVTEEVATDILERFNGNLTRLAKATVGELKEIGVTALQADTIIAAIELGKRISCFTEDERPAINTPADAAKVLMPTMRYLKKETFKTLLLDTKNRLIKIENISTGILDASLVHVREVFAPAILEGASSILLAHNHPSGNCIPSSQDLEITRNLMEASKIMQIDILDHIILGDGRFLSLKEKKLI